MFSFLNYIIIIKTEILFPQTHVTLVDFGYRVLALWLYWSQRV